MVFSVAGLKPHRLASFRECLIRLPQQVESPGQALMRPTIVRVESDGLTCLNQALVRFALQIECCRQAFVRRRVVGIEPDGLAFLADRLVQVPFRISVQPRRA